MDFFSLGFAFLYCSHLGVFFFFKVDLKESIYLKQFFLLQRYFPLQSLFLSCLCRYLSTLASSTLIILFSEMLKVSNFISSKSKNIVKENSGYFFLNLFIEMNVSKLISYLMDKGSRVLCE